MSSAPAAPADNLCPSCSAPVPVDPRFVTWCPACEWNVDPTATVPVEVQAVPAETGARRRRAARREEARRAAVHVAAERLYAEVVGEARPRLRRDGSWFIAMALAGVIHLAAVALVAGSVWALLAGPLMIRVLGAAGLVAAVVLRPRLGRFGRDEWSLSRAEAPRLYELADRVAAEVGAPPVDLIRLTPDFGAVYEKVGLRQRSVLTFGLSMWEVLTSQERVGLLAHEFGHALNGELRRGLWFYSAYLALYRCYKVTDSRGAATTDPDIFIEVGRMVLAPLLFVPNKIAELVLILLGRHMLRANQRAEYLADDLAARIASSAAARSYLEVLALQESLESLFYRQIAAYHRRHSFHTDSGEGHDFGLWQALREYVASIPETERLRLLRVSALHMMSVDTTHPPTHLRIRLVDARGHRETRITLPEPEVAAIEAELGSVRARAARAVLTFNH
ncbi:M48 family metallopeptidase [Streptosporangium sp. NPDC051022]|uniref:M48 family metallopeptidase n=1 Tax=Streptosporangium sp. NPDC051022 TaxID=3155752 RepID=UPI0034371B2E